VCWVGVCACVRESVRVLCAREWVDKYVGCVCVRV